MFYPTQGVTSYHPEWVPEFFGDVAVVNAKIWPYVDVEPRRYRLRIVNGSQSRFYNLQFADENSGKALPFTQIGTEGGLLRAPVPMTALLIAPGERADLIIDFGDQRNASFIVTNNARAPYPAGGRAGLSQLLKIRVNRALQGSDTTTPAANLQLPPLPFLPAPSVTRVQHLSETLDPLTGNPINLNIEDAPYLDERYASARRETSSSATQSRLRRTWREPTYATWRSSRTSPKRTPSTHLPWRQ